MKKMIRFASLVLALCMVCGAALAESGIGDAAAYVPDAAPAYVEPAAAPVNGAAAPAATEAPALEANPLATENSTKGFVYRMYQVVLGREPDEGGFNNWVKTLEDGTARAADLVIGFFNSDEYTNKAKPSEQVVNDCYKAMLNRDADAAGMEGWKQALDIGMSPDVVCAGFVASDEFKNLTEKYGIKPGTITLSKARDQNYDRTWFVYRLYQECLNRAPEMAGLEAWCQALGAGSEGTSVAYGFVFSTEYEDKLPTNDEFITMLYRTILGRTADNAGMQGWVNELNYTSTREKVLNGFMFSPEFAAMCTRAGIKVGSKVNEPDNTREWKANILVLSLVNAARSRQGLLPLVTREDLWERVALVRAAEVTKVHTHIRPDGTQWTTAYEQGGFVDSYAAENIAWGFTSEQEVVQAWLNSKTHRENILNSNLTVLATGLHGSEWSQNFYTEVLK